MPGEQVRARVPVAAELGGHLIVDVGQALQQALDLGSLRVGELGVEVGVKAEDDVRKGRGRGLVGDGEEG